MCKNMVESDRPQMMICCYMAHAHCVLTNEDYRHSAYQYFLLFHGNDGYVNARHCYVLRTVRGLLLHGLGDSDVE
jgi:isochorismate hydrolase